MKDELQSDNTALRDEIALVTDHVEKGLKKVGASLSIRASHMIYELHS